MLNSERLTLEAKRKRDDADNVANNYTTSGQFELHHIATNLEMAAGLFAIAEAINNHRSGSTGDMLDAAYGG